MVEEKVSVVHRRQTGESTDERDHRRGLARAQGMGRALWGAICDPRVWLRDSRNKIRFALFLICALVCASFALVGQTMAMDKDVTESYPPPVDYQLAARDPEELGRKLLGSLATQRCPGGLFYYESMYEVPRHFPERPLPLVDVPALSGPHKDQGPDPKLSKGYKIPLLIHQSSYLDRVPVSMYGAMKTIRRHNSRFGFRYYSQRAIEQLFEREFKDEFTTVVTKTNNNTKTDTYKNPHLYALRKLHSIEHKLELGTWAYLWLHGGIHLHAASFATRSLIPKRKRKGLMKSLMGGPNTPEDTALIQPVDELIISTVEAESIGAIGGPKKKKPKKKRIHTMDLVAAKRRHPFIGYLLNRTVEAILRDQRGNSYTDVTGGDMFGRVLRDYRKKIARARLKMVTALVYPTVRRTNSKKTNETLEDECAVNALIPSGITPSTLLPSVSLWTRYPTFVKDWRQYRPWWEDDPKSIWKRGTLIGRPDQCTIGKLTTTLVQEVGQGNRQPLESQQLVDMAPYTPPRRLPTPQEQEQMIPFTIMQTAMRDRVPIGMRQAIQTILDLNPEYEHHYYSDRRIRDFIAQHFDTRTLTAFDDLIPGAFKADLFRYCYLYVRGGVFLDGDAYAVRPLSYLLRPGDSFVSAEDNGIGWVHNAFLAATPKHPIFKAAIDRVVENVEKRDYGKNRMSITGPELLKNVFRDYVKGPIKAPVVYIAGSHPGVTRLVHYWREHHCMVGWLERAPLKGEDVPKDPNDVADQNVVFYMRFPMYRAELRWYHTTKVMYQTLYRQRRVFRGWENSTLVPSWQSPT